MGGRSWTRLLAISCKDMSMNNVQPLHRDVAQLEEISERLNRLDRGGGGGDNGDMDTRVKALETAMVSVNDRLAKIETRLDHMPTKSDLSDAMTGQLKWIVGTAIVLGAAAITVMTFVLNNAIPTQSTQAPTVIVNVPPDAAAPDSPSR